MGGTRSENWFNQVLEKLLTGSVVIVDDAPYRPEWQEAVPRTGFHREAIQQRLMTKGILWDIKMTKKRAALRQCGTNQATICEVPAAPWSGFHPTTDFNPTKLF